MKKFIAIAILCSAMLALVCGCELVNEKEEPLGNAVYSNSEIEEMAKAGLTLDEAAEKISTVTDAMNYLRACGYKDDFSYNSNAFDENDNDWHWVMSAQFTYDHMAGTCGGTSNLFNYLLKDDYDEEGYVLQTEHVFNYFKDDGVYYFCDFAGPWFVENPDEVVQCSTVNPEDYVDVYMEKEPDADNFHSDFYLTYVFMCAQNGEDCLPMATLHEDEDGKDVDEYERAYFIGVPDTAENLIILFEREGYSIKVVPAPPDDLKPAEVNIPNDEGVIVN